MSTLDTISVIGWVRMEARPSWLFLTFIPSFFSHTFFYLPYLPRCPDYIHPEYVILDHKGVIYILSLFLYTIWGIIYSRTPVFLLWSLILPACPYIPWILLLIFFLCRNIAYQWLDWSIFWLGPFCIWKGSSCYTFYMSAL